MSQFIGFGSGKDGAISNAGSIAYVAGPMVAIDVSGKKLRTFDGFSIGDIVIIHQTQGAGAGAWEFNRIVGKSEVGSGYATYEMQFDFSYSYIPGTQMVRMNQFQGGTFNANISVPAWNGLYGGVYGIMCNGQLTYAGTIAAAGKGYRGGTAINPTSQTGYQGENFNNQTLSQSTSANNNGGGGGGGDTVGSGSNGAGGGGGGHASNGANGETAGVISGGQGGTTGATPDLSTMIMGGGGGAGGTDDNPAGTPSGAGGSGGGMIVICAKQFVYSSGSISANGDAGSNSVTFAGAGGGGAGGSVYIISQKADLGTNVITATGGAGGVNAGSPGDGGAGGNGRIAVRHSQPVTGSTNPTFDDTTDQRLQDAGGAFLRNFV
jgi:hypothetical protein